MIFIVNLFSRVAGAAGIYVLPRLYQYFTSEPYIIQKDRCFGAISLAEKKESTVKKAPSTYKGTSSDKPGGRKPKPKPKTPNKRQSMLNTQKLAPFKYDMNEVLSASAMDPAKASAFLASVIAKGSRVSTKSAKDYAKTFLEAGDLSKEDFDKVCRLMDKYSKYR